MGSGGGGRNFTFQHKAMRKPGLQVRYQSVICIAQILRPKSDWNMEIESAIDEYE